MKFWQWVLLALVIVGVGSVVRPAAGMAANWDRTASAFTGGGDAWLMGDPDGGNGKVGQGPSHGYGSHPVALSGPIAGRHSPLWGRTTWIHLLWNDFLAIHR
jgi:hypothetical protein